MKMQLVPSTARASRKCFMISTGKTRLQQQAMCNLRDEIRDEKMIRSNLLWFQCRRADFGCSHGLRLAWKKQWRECRRQTSAWILISLVAVRAVSAYPRSAPDLPGLKSGQASIERKPIVEEVSSSASDWTNDENRLLAYPSITTATAVAFKAT